MADTFLYFPVFFLSAVKILKHRAKFKRIAISNFLSYSLDDGIFSVPFLYTIEKIG
jgi:hypothetical protein